MQMWLTAHNRKLACELDRVDRAGVIDVKLGKHDPQLVFRQRDAEMLVQTLMELTMSKHMSKHMSEHMPKHV